MSKKEHPDTIRLKKLLKNLEWDGYAYWLPEWAVKERKQLEEDTPEPTLQEFRKAIDDRECRS